MGGESRPEEGVRTQTGEGQDLMGVSSLKKNGKKEGRAEQSRGGKREGSHWTEKKNTDKNTMRGDNSAKGEEKSLPWSGREGCRDGVCVCVCHCVREGEDRE